jgi:hypothetical protein
MIPLATFATLFEEAFRSHAHFLAESYQDSGERVRKSSCLFLKMTVRGLVDAGGLVPYFTIFPGDPGLATVRSAQQGTEVPTQKRLLRGQATGFVSNPGGCRPP